MLGGGRRCGARPSSRMKYFGALLLFASALAGVRAQNSWTVTRTNLPGVTQAYSVAFGNGRFVATLAGSSEAPSVAWTTDAITWHGVNAGIPQQGTIEFVAGAFYLAVDNGVWRSPDGENWTSIFNSTNVNVAFRGIATNGHSMMLGSAKINVPTPFFSTDRLTWRATTPPPNPGPANSIPMLLEFAYFAGRYYVRYNVDFQNGTSRDYVVSTVDGSDWTMEPAVVAALYLAVGNGRLVGLGGPDGGTVVTTDAVHFASAPLIPGIMNGGRLVFAGGRFFFLGSFYASVDGLVWSPIAPGSSVGGSPSDIAYGNGRYVSVGYTYVGGSRTTPPVMVDLIASLAANAPPIFATQPIDQTVIEGRLATLGITLDNPDLATTFQWRHDGAAIAGATSATYAIPSTKIADSGRYTVDVSNGQGAVTSDTARLTVAPIAQAGRIVNLSVLAALDGSSRDFTMGFVVGGAGTHGTKALLARAGGPSLVRFGVVNPNPDPKLELFSRGAKIGENDNWGGTPSLLTATAQVGAYAYVSPDSKDAALFSDQIGSGDGSVQVASVAGAIGTVIAEVYDATPDSAFTAATPRLVNVSVLRNISAGAPLNAGFVIGGVTSKTVLIRAIGPSLTAFGVAGALANPALALFQGSVPTAIATNDDWGGGAGLRSAFATVGAFALDPISKDAALVITLSPGNYTAQVSGVNSSTGMTLVEVYEMP